MPAHLTDKQLAGVIGKTVKSLTRAHDPSYDDTDVMRMEFVDGTAVVFTARYDDYTGNSRDEYPCIIDVQPV